MSPSDFQRLSWEDYCNYQIYGTTSVSSSTFITAAIQGLTSASQWQNLNVSTCALQNAYVQNTGYVNGVPIGNGEFWVASPTEDYVISTNARYYQPRNTKLLLLCP